MQIEKDVVVKGAGFFAGNVEGTDYDNGQVFIEEAFDPSKDNYKGFRTVEYKCVDSQVVRPLMHLPFPITAKVSFERRGRVVTDTPGISDSIRGWMVEEPISRVSSRPRR